MPPNIRKKHIFTPFLHATCSDEPAVRENIWRSARHAAFVVTINRLRALPLEFLQRDPAIFIFLVPRLCSDNHSDSISIALLSDGSGHQIWAWTAQWQLVRRSRLDIHLSIDGTSLPRPVRAQAVVCLCFWACDREIKTSQTFHRSQSCRHHPLEASSANRNPLRSLLLSYRCA